MYKPHNIDMPTEDKLASLVDQADRMKVQYEEMLLKIEGLKSQLNHYTILAQANQKMASLREGLEKLSDKQLVERLDLVESVHNAYYPRYRHIFESQWEDHDLSQDDVHPESVTYEEERVDTLAGEHQSEYGKTYEFVYEELYRRGWELAPLSLKWRKKLN